MRIPFGFASGGADRALLEEQFRSLRDQIPVMYGILLVNVTSLSLATYGIGSPLLSLGLPLSLSLACVLRTIVWLRRSEVIPPVNQIRRSLAVTLTLSVLLAIGYVAWALVLFPHADLIQRTCIGLFVFAAAITCAFSLQRFPPAAGAVLLIGTVPVAIRLMLAQHWFLIGLALNLLFVAILVQRIVKMNHTGLVEVVASRSRVLLESERARDAERQAHRLAYNDPLTGLPNRRALAERLDRIIESREAHSGAALLMVDLDRFKSVNDVHGHLVGDDVLRKVAGRLRNLVEPTAEAYRLGGDEFALVIMLDRAAGVSPTRVARKVVDGLAGPLTTTDIVHHIGASVGIAYVPLHADDREALMRKADIALYEAKNNGRGTHRLFSPEMEDAIRRRSTIESRLRKDMSSGAIRPYLQPIVDLQSREVVGYEMLARWSREGAFVVGPDQFIPIAEECGLINELMLALLEQGCREGKVVTDGRPIAVNISPVQLKDPQLGERILNVLESVDYPASQLGIEVTENALVSDSSCALRTIEILKGHGVQVALDDFGTGYSSLRHLHLLPFDKIKIDRSFVMSMGSDDEALKIVRAIISLAGSMGLCAVAEGVESEDVALRLESLGCAQGQGYHFSRPFPIRRTACATEVA